MKRNLALILFFSMLAGLTACGESSGVSETTEPTGETITPESGYTFRKDWSGETVSNLNYDFKPMQEVEQEFLELFGQLSAEIRG